MALDRRPKRWTEAAALSFIAQRRHDPEIGTFAELFNDGAWAKIEDEWPEFATIFGLVSPAPTSGSEAGGELVAGLIDRLSAQAKRLDDRARMNDRASTSSNNPDAAGTFASWAVMERERAADLRLAIAALATPAPSPAGGDWKEQAAQWHRERSKRINGVALNTARADFHRECAAELSPATAARGGVDG